MKDILKIIFACISILGGLIAIISVAGAPDLIIAFISLSFGVMAVIWTLMAHGSLSPGSSLRGYTSYFLMCVILLVVYSIWNSAVNLFGLTGIWAYGEYVFITATYIVFVVAAFKIYHLGMEFGFQKAADRINKEMKKDKYKAGNRLM